MRLYHYHESSASYRVRIALALKNIDVEYCSVDIRGGAQHSPAYRAINRQGLVPCLEIEPAFQCGQSIAILEFLEEKYPSPSLLPSDMKGRIWARSIAQQIASDVGPFQKTTLQHHLRDEHRLDDAALAGWLEFWMLRGLSPIEDWAASKMGEQGLLFGPNATIAECCIVPQIHNLRRFGTRLELFPNLVELENRCMELTAFQTAHPDAWKPVAAD